MATSIGRVVLVISCHRRQCLSFITSRSLERKFSTTSFASWPSKCCWLSVIGLEIHAQIKSASKLFSGASTQYGASTNTQVAFFDAAIPGTLPVLNQKCVEAGVLTALALGCDINMVSKFDRKHYFYADMPAGYQITQQRKPLAVNGQFNYVYQSSVTKLMERRSGQIVQLQLEQDSGKSLHDSDQKISLIDLNRAGIGLMEIVTAPDFTDGDDAASFVRDLKSALETIGSCDGKMEEGSLRVDANVSIHRPGEPWGTRTEVKNLNSLKSIKLAIDYEIGRHIQVLEDGGIIENETRAFDMEAGETLAMRDKEKILDYRFMPEPNLPPLVIFANCASVPSFLSGHKLVLLEDVKAKLIELPDEKRRRLEEVYGLPLASAVALVRAELSELFELLVTKYACHPKATSIVLATFYTSFLTDPGQGPIADHHLAELIYIFGRREMNGTSFMTLMREKAANPDKPCKDIIAILGLAMISDTRLISAVIDDVLGRNPKIVKAYKKGKDNQLAILTTKVMKRLDDKADTNLLWHLLKEKLTK